MKNSQRNLSKVQKNYNQLKLIKKKRYLVVISRLANTILCPQKLNNIINKLF